MPERLKAILDKITAWWKKFNSLDAPKNPFPKYSISVRARS